MIVNSIGQTIETIEVKETYKNDGRNNYKGDRWDNKGGYKGDNKGNNYEKVVKAV